MPRNYEGLSIMARFLIAQKTDNFKIMKLLSTFILFLTLSVSTFSQVLSGTITNYNGEIVPYATVYIEELRQGTTASAKGVYSVRIPAGDYNITYQSMGYGVVYDKVSIKESLVKDVELPMQYYTLPEVRVTSSGEDPAYSIMRKAIGMASYYLNHVQSYSADVYLRGNLTIQKMPKIVQNRVNKEIQKQARDLSINADNLKLKEGDVFFSESYNEINFTAPNNYVQRVVSAQNSFPIDIDEISAMDYVQTSFYEPMIVDMAISPLAPQALSYYNFKFLGATEQGNLLIDKIEVTPKRKNQQLFTGEIYIIEGLWCIHSLNLTNENFAGNINIKQIYIEVEKDVWLPVSNQLSFDASLLGVWANFNYSNSTQYTNITLNNNLSKPIATSSTISSTIVESQTTPPPQSANSDKIAELLDKDDLSNREMNQLTKLVEREAAEALSEGLQNAANQRIGTTKIVADDAFSKDKQYWEEVRTIPLSIDERAIERSIDTAKLLRSSSAVTIANQVTKPTGGDIAKNILLGKTWNANSQFAFQFGGLLNTDYISFNSVDGFLYGFDFRLSQSFANRGELSVSPFFQYAFGRKKILWGVDANYKFNDNWKNSLSATVGSTSTDFNNGKIGIHHLVNTFSTLFFRENLLKLFGKDYVSIKYSAQPSDNISFSIAANYNNRYQLENTTDFAFFKTNKQYTPNIPNNENYSFFDHQHLDITARIDFKPGIRYLSYNDIRISNGASLPSFSLEWQHGINTISDKYLHYDRYKLSISMRHDINFFSSIDWIATFGGMINGNNASFADISHFNTQEFAIVDDKYSDMFLLPAAYSLSTPKIYMEGHVEYTATQIILKYLPIISNTIWRENLNISFLASKYRPFYFEAGYSLSEILFIGQAGIFVGFEDFKYKNIGFKLIFRLDYF